ncbi:hypothetical protein [Brevundimonas sp.]|jgi:hypothetical protein|uniref:hypothetical protein n=1 Tax=Brevundimonas sp. TaxID=1871086 RepID=UPI0037C18B73
MKLSRWIGGGVTVLLLAMSAHSFWQRWSSFRSEQPDASAWVFVREESILWVAFVAIGVGLMLVVALNDNFDRMTKPHLTKVLPFLLGGLSLAIIGSAILIWVGSAWAPLSIAIGIGLAVYSAKAAGLEAKPRSDNLPRVEG